MEPNQITTDEKIENIEKMCLYLKEICEQLRMAKSIATETNQELHIKLGEFNFILKDLNITIK